MFLSMKNRQVVNDQQTLKMALSKWSVFANDHLIVRVGVLDEVSRRSPAGIRRTLSDPGAAVDRRVVDGPEERPVVGVRQDRASKRGRLLTVQERSWSGRCSSGCWFDGSGWNVTKSRSTAVITFSFPKGWNNKQEAESKAVKNFS